MLTDVRLTEPALGRMLGFGDIQILTASGAAGEDEFKTVQRAAALRTAIQEQKARTLTGSGRRNRPAAGRGSDTRPGSRRRVPTTAPAPAALPADDPAARLTQLADLRDKGLITAEEYDAKKTELLGRICIDRRPRSAGQARSQPGDLVGQLGLAGPGALDDRAAAPWR